MSTTITARVRPDGAVVEVLPDGSERLFPRTPMPPMTEAEVHAAALADPDAQPVTPERLRRFRRVPRVKTLRRALGLSRAQFAQRYRIPLEMLCEWEQGYREPDALASAYLHVIAHDPEAVASALRSAPGA